MSSPQTGLSGHAVPLLSEEDGAAYQALVTRLLQKYDPRGDEERALVQSIADADWRLSRIPALEAGIYAVGRLEFAALFAEEQDPAARRQLLDAKVFLVYQRPLNNLSVQEGRLRRQREKDIKALHELLQARKHQVTPPGFDFSKAQTEAQPHKAGRDRTGAVSLPAAQANIVSSDSQRNARPHLLAANSATGQGAGCGHRG